MTARCDGSGKTLAAGNEPDAIYVPCPGCSACLQGPALDAAVAERVLGCRAQYTLPLGVKPPTAGPFCNCKNGEHERGSASGFDKRIKFYSSDPVACDELKRWLRENGVYFSVVYWPKRHPANSAISVQEAETRNYVSGSTEPLAVARFALRLFEDGLLPKIPKEAK